MSRRRFFYVFLVLFLSSVPMVFNSCGSSIDFGQLDGNGSTSGGSTAGDPMTELSIGFYPFTWPNALPPTSYSLSFCHEQVRFSRFNSTDFIRPVLLTAQDIVVSPSGVDVETVLAQSDRYDGVRLDARSVCPSGTTLSVTNQYGTFSISDNYVMDFTGDATLDGSPRIIRFNIQPFVDRLMNVRANSEILPALRDVRGTFD